MAHPAVLDVDQYVARPQRPALERPGAQRARFVAGGVPLGADGLRLIAVPFAAARAVLGEDGARTGQ
ncbi:hypothetical protein [Arhodomonas aquaeolei]|uniref:hypothetical protein n=1 Tax=Arhodomonas aquaeolei TaxID=2369 RepID=UPI001B7F9D47|nr:hypothetical protein [Arhodomonas aquaeolei]